MDVIAVDDDRSGLELLAMLLESAGHRVRSSEDIAGGLSLLEEALPAVVVTDLMVGPGRDGGYRLISTMRANPDYDTVAIVALTGITSVDDLDRAHNAGADICVGKPFEIEEFLTTLEAVSAARRG